MIEARGIHKRYGDLDVLKGVDLRVETGEVVSIVGASGAGKTTLLQILGTLELADRGTLHIGGTEVGTLSSRALSTFRNTHIGFVFQFHHLLPAFSALENVTLPMLMRHGHVDPADKARACELLAAMGLGHALHKRPGELSGGMQQRVAIDGSCVTTRKAVPNSSCRRRMRAKTSSAL